MREEPGNRMPGYYGLGMIRRGKKRERDRESLTKVPGFQFGFLDLDRLFSSFSAFAVLLSRAFQVNITTGLLT